MKSFIKQAHSFMARMGMCTYLYCLILQWMIRIGNVFQCDAIELSFVDVCDAIVFTSLR